MAEVAKEPKKAPKYEKKVRSACSEEQKAELLAVRKKIAEMRKDREKLMTVADKKYKVFASKIQPKEIFPEVKPTPL
jgi:hypothetical protein